MSTVTGIEWTGLLCEHAVLGGLMDTRRTRHCRAGDRVTRLRTVRRIARPQVVTSVSLRPR